MRFSNIGYVFSQGLKGISRNKMFSMASIATMAACIFLFGLFFSLLLNMQNIARKAEEGVVITVFFNENIDEDIYEQRIDEIRQELLSHPDVSGIHYISAEEAWERFVETFFDGNEDLARGFEGNNPLANSSHFEVSMVLIDDDRSLLARRSTLSEIQGEVVRFAEEVEGVRLVNRSDAVAITLSHLNMLVGYVSLAIIAILLGVSVFLISNSVTMGITVRKEEIAIMKYIGARNFVVRAPFVIEGLIMGLVGAIIPLTLLYVLYEMAVLGIMTRFTTLANILDFLPVGAVFHYLLPFGLAMGVGIGFVGSYFTVFKHLRV